MDATENQMKSGDKESDSDDFYGTMKALRRQLPSASSVRPNRMTSKFGSIIKLDEPKPKENTGGEHEHYYGNSGLPSAEDAINNVDLAFKREFEANQDRCTVSPSDCDNGKAGGGNDEPKRLFKLPDITWHVPMTSFEFLKEEKARLAREAETSNARRDRSIATDVKSKEKSKRLRGQSSQETWKSETFMKMKQEFD